MKRAVLLCALSFISFFSQAQFLDSVIAGQISDSLKTIPTPFNVTLKKVAIPAILMGTGIITTLWNNPESLKNEIVEGRNNHFYDFNTHIDNYLQFSPIVIAYGLDAFGVKSKTDFMNRSVILFKTEIFALASVSLLKNITHEKRPDGSDYKSFPSGHTTEAFAAATFLSEEYKDRFKWMPYAAYTIATGVGVMRMGNNKHYIGDVLMGAGLGIICTKVAYWTHQYKWGKAKRPVVY